MALVHRRFSWGIRPSPARAPALGDAPPRSAATRGKRRAAAAAGGPTRPLPELFAPPPSCGKDSWCLDSVKDVVLGHGFPLSQMAHKKAGNGFFGIPQTLKGVHPLDTNSNVKEAILPLHMNKWDKIEAEKDTYCVCVRICSSVSNSRYTCLCIRAPMYT